MKPLPPARDNDDASFRWLVWSLISGFIDSLRRNKLATALAAITLVVSIIAAANSQFDERPRYQRFILPDLSRAETTFLTTMQFAEYVDDARRRRYFIEAHRQAKNIIRVAKSNWPATYTARQMHRDLILYYELVDEEFAILRTEMSMNENLDIMSRWQTKRQELKPIRDRWAQWIGEQN